MCKYKIKFIRLESKSSLPEKTVERLSIYRRSLLDCIARGKYYIYSHEIAALHHITAVQVRRDIMLIGYSSKATKGYHCQELIDLIGEIIDTDPGQNIAVIGIGNLGRALIGYFKGKRARLTIVACFDVNPEKVGKSYSGVECYDMKRLPQILRSKKITIGIITVPPDKAVEVSTNLINSGIKGILNYTSTKISVPENVFLEEIDMTTSLEKVAYFAKYL